MKREGKEDIELFEDICEKRRSDDVNLGGDDSDVNTDGLFIKNVEDNIDDGDKNKEVERSLKREAQREGHMLNERQYDKDSEVEQHEDIVMDRTQIDSQNGYTHETDSYGESADLTDLADGSRSNGNAGTDTWTCAGCTYTNSNKVFLCDMCGTASG